jgi:hypothetical protein
MFDATIIAIELCGRDAASLERRLAYSRAVMPGETKPVRSSLVLSREPHTLPSFQQVRMGLMYWLAELKFCSRYGRIRFARNG